MKAFFYRILPSYLDYWKRAFDFNGRTKRIDFWAATLMGILATFLAGLLIDLILISPFDLATIENFEPDSIQKSWFYAAWEAINGIPLLAMEIRRNRDAGAKAWIIALAFSGLINTFIVLIEGPLVPAVSQLPAARIIFFIIGIPPLIYTFLPSNNKITEINNGIIAS
jgi:uncharacterized membrane protein YhaH (DUF805 family)